MGNGDEYLDLSSAVLTASISVGGDTNPTKVHKSAPVKNWVQSLISQVDVFLNDKIRQTPTRTARTSKLC